MMYIVLGLLALPLILLAIPVRLYLDYHDRVMRLRLGHGLLRFQLLPKRKKKRSKHKTSQPAPAPAPKRGVDMDAVYDQAELYLPLIQQVLGQIPKIFGAVCIDRLTVHVHFYQDDPADLALHYGQAWAASGWIVAAVGRLFPIKRQDVRPIIDPNGFQLSLSIRVRVLGWKLVVLAVRLLIQFLRLRRQMI